MSDLMQRALKVKVKGVDTFSAEKSSLLRVPKDLYIPTSLPAFNIALSGDVKTGFGPGVNILAGESGVGKTLLSWIAAKAFQKKNPDGIVLFYDSEQGTPEDYLISMGIDIARVIHIPVMNIEEMKFDMVAKLSSFENGDKVFVLVDSLGNIASIKEITDAKDEKTVADMSRAKAMKSFFRMVTPLVSTKRIYFFGIQHTYQEIGMFPKTIVGGGTGSVYASNTILVLTKSQEKDGTEQVGININMGIYKSRYVREKQRIKLTLKYASGFDTFAGLLDLFIELGLVHKPNNRRYCIVDTDGVIDEDNSMYRKDIETPAIIMGMLRRKDVQDQIKMRYQLSGDGKQTVSDDFDVDLLDMEPELLLEEDKMSQGMISESLSADK